MQRKHQKDKSTVDSHKSTPSKKSKTRSNKKSKEDKISIEKLSHALYNKKPTQSLKKIVFYDQFEAEDLEVEGSMTSRYLPVEKDGEFLKRCQKIADLNSRKATSQKKRGKAEAERRLGEGRGKKKDKKMQKNLERMNVGQSEAAVSLI